MKKAVIILSGGMDSTTLLYNVNALGAFEVFALSFYYGQKHCKELKCAKQTCKKLLIPHKILDLSMLGEIAPSSLTRGDQEVPEGYYTDKNMKQTVVPNRNMVMISLAVSYAIGIGAEKVYYGAHAGDHDIYPDCRREFVEALSKAVTLCDWAKVQLYAPYLDRNKKDILVEGKRLGVDYSLTWSCYKGGERACGKCGTCVERLEAFADAGLDDPIQYEKGGSK